VPRLWVELMRPMVEGLILEFGVAGGGSITEFAELFSNETVYGFDWWQGLPQSWGEQRRGTFACPKPEVPGNVVLLDGLFSDTLPGFLRTNLSPVKIVHIDCDLYASAAYVLNALRERFVSGSLVIFDELYEGERRDELVAWNRFQRERWHLLCRPHLNGACFQKD